MAHTQWDLVKKLIKELDDDRNDIFIHIDKKIPDPPIAELNQTAKRSNLIMVERVKVYRGSFSLFEAELNLLKTALGTDEYTYYHLLSGQDLPLRNQDTIHAFFDENNGYNFVDVVPLENMRDDWYERIILYQFFSKYTLTSSIVALPARCIRKVSILIQRALGINRFCKYEKQGLILRFGSNWFSITRPFAEYIVENEGLIRTLFGKRTFAPEEFIVQTLICSSEYKDTLYEGDYFGNSNCRANMRMIYWDGHVSPVTITKQHISDLEKSPSLFARKFDLTAYPDAVQEVLDMVNLDK